MYFVVSVVICLPSQKPYHGKGEELASCVPSNCLPALPASADGPRCGLQIQHLPFCTYWPWLCDWLWKLTEWYLSLINWETTSKISSGNGNGMGGRMGVGRSQEWWCWPWETWSYEGEEPGSKQKKPFPKGNRGQNTERADRPEVREIPVEPARFVMLLKWEPTGVLGVLSPFLLMEWNNTMGPDSQESNTNT